MVLKFIETWALRLFWYCFVGSSFSITVNHFILLSQADWFLLLICNKTEPTNFRVRILDVSGLLYNWLIPTELEGLYFRHYVFPCHLLEKLCTGPVMFLKCSRNAKPRRFFSTTKLPEASCTHFPCFGTPHIRISSLTTRPSDGLLWYSG